VNFIVFVAVSEEKKPTGRKCEWRKDNIKKDFKGIGCDSAN
jgi:hypothetical protein